ncbi:hypothetical protein Adt_05443 [Abeliophyllum distichum]|uniref:Uncharacterized protein n=1 Tax=Abeliophyllum distichum TaxID=126358 RepID=A0ABD1V435_9LAMI
MIEASKKMIWLQSFLKELDHNHGEKFAQGRFKGDPSQFQSNVPNQPTKPPDISSSMVGHHSPAIPIPNTGPTPQNSSLTLPVCHQTAGTLNLDPIEAAAPTNGGLVTGQSSINLPPMDDQFEGFVTS